MADVIILGDPGFGRIYAHEEAASRIQGHTAIALGSAAELAEHFKTASAPKLLVLDYGWTDVVPRILYEAFEHDKVKSFSTLVIKNEYGSIAERNLENYFDLKGYIDVSLQGNEALPNIINAFLQYAEGKEIDEIKRKDVRALINQIAENITDDFLGEYAKAVHKRDPRYAEIFSRKQPQPQLG